MTHAGSEVTSQGRTPVSHYLRKAWKTEKEFLAMDKTEEKTGKWYNIYVVKCNQSESNAIKQTIVYTSLGLGWIQSLPKGWDLN